jgi:hypothetical protein
MTGIYPPTGDTGELVDKISELPNINHWLKEQNEFYRLYEDVNGVKYIYRNKSVNSPLCQLIKKERDERVISD